ncbi:IclR family transcriptional regulator [Pseudomonas sp. BF-R-19]|uniref:IclR family transcriptional regulator n=1 Tax=Pseudomonas sp. BF-R-19 TaxID=2832397 RepID=UPI001CBD4495|nr:IclR family transcriptional regulator [Pseudomonas sp. BF-R-19]
MNTITLRHSWSKWQKIYVLNGTPPATQWVGLEHMSDKAISKETQQAEKDASGPRSVMRILGLFEALARATDGLSLADLSIELGAPKSSLLTLLRPLVAESYLSHGKSRYRLGPRIFRMSADILAAHKIRTLIEPYVEQLAERTHETVYFAVLGSSEPVAVAIEVINSAQALLYNLRVGMTFPLYQTAAGNVLLAYQDKESQESYLRSIKAEKLKVDEFSPRVPLSPSELRQRLSDIRKTGISISIGQWTPHSGALAAPVFNADGSLAGALAIAGPADRLQSNLEQLTTVLKNIAAAASGQ